MTRNKLKEILRAKKGYYNNGKLKKGIKWLSTKFNVSEDIVRQSLIELRNERNIVPEKLIKVISENNQIYVGKPVPNRIVGSNDFNITKAGTYWITGCAHAPFHNKAMYESTLNFLEKEVSLEGIVLNGDFLDLNSLSSHDRGKIALPGVNLAWEYEESNKFLDEIQDLLKSKGADIRQFIYGNHEDRFLRTMKDVDTSKYGRALKSPEEALKLADRGFITQTDWKNSTISIGPHLDVIHGEFFNIHSAKKHIDTYRKSIMYAHTHRIQIYMEGDVGGFNIGAGADFNSLVFGYASRAMKKSWANASALVTLDENGFFHVQLLNFRNNKLIINGKEY